MSVQYMFRRMSLSRALLLASLSTGAVVVACGSGDLVIGDDSRDASTSTDSSTSDGDAGSNDKDGATVDAQVDASPGACAAAPGGPGICLPKGTGCLQADTTGLTCAASGQLCCLQPCPSLAQPPAGFCDGGPIVPLYNAKACVSGFGCAPVACATAGGTCVAVVPGACAPDKIGDAAKYSCGGGVGTACCLP